MRESGFGTAARDPCRKAIWIVIAAISGLPVRRAAKFRCPYNQGRIEQTALFQIVQQCGDRLIDRFRHHSVILFNFCMGVPTAIGLVV